MHQIITLNTKASNHKPICRLINKQRERARQGQQSLI